MILKEGEPSDLVRTLKLNTEALVKHLGILDF